MSYTVRIDFNGNKEETKREWLPLKKTSAGETLYDYAPPMTCNTPFCKKIYEQTVEELDIDAVILAVLGSRP